MVWRAFHHHPPPAPQPLTNPSPTSFSQAPSLLLFVQYVYSIVQHQYQAQNFVFKTFFSKLFDIALVCGPYKHFKQ